MRDNLIVPVILAGGKGTRLWPLSRIEKPKQFISLMSDHSLFQQTLLRVNDPSRYAAPIIVTNVNYEFQVKEQAKSCGVALGSIILEPIARNTAPAICAAALVAERQVGSILHIMPADHQITQGAEYDHALQIGLTSALGENLVTFGIQPTSAATGYGYIEAAYNGFQEAPAVSRFIEKPDAMAAERLLSNRDVLWNSGMFLFQAKVFLDECRDLAPEVYYPVVSAFERAKMTGNCLRLDSQQFHMAADISIDYAIMEKTEKARVVPACFHWSDVGSWDSVWKESDGDLNGNVVKGPVRIQSTTNSLIVSNGIQVAVNGVDDLAIIASDDVIYVGRTSASQCISQIVTSLAKEPKTAALIETHRTTERPWGGYTQLMQGDRFQVKRLFIEPGKKLSLQKHHHRSEHWIIVRGAAEVTCENEIFVINEGQSTHIPIGAVHRVHNPGKILLEMIEIQTGSYLGEDDITRLEDDFGRATQSPATEALSTL